MDTVIFFTYFTVNTPYEAEAAKLRETAQAIGIELVEYPFSSTGSWEKNSSYKYQFMIHTLRSYGCPVVALDSDARILKPLDYFNSIREDIGFHMLRRPTMRPELADGTLYMRPACIPLCQEIIDRCERDPSKWDQRHLQDFIEYYGVGYNDLPASFCAIDGMYGEQGISSGKDIHILHTQASRRNKAIINGE